MVTLSGMVRVSWGKGKRAIEVKRLARPRDAAESLECDTIGELLTELPVPVYVLVDPAPCS